MKPATALLLIMLAIAIVAVAGCALPKNGQGLQKNWQPPKELAKNFYEFDQATYENALKQGKDVFLDFSANWCEICRAEGPTIKAAFNDLDSSNVVGFKVNYNDDQTDANEKALARKFNVPYQHTKLLVSPQETVLSRNYNGPSSKQEILSQIKDATK